MRRSYYKNAKPNTVMVSVDVNGIGYLGETFRTRADPQHVIDDLVWEVPVVMLRPDGSYEMGTRIVVTTEGVAAGLTPNVR